MNDLLSISRPVNSCGKMLMKLEAYSGCDEDNFTDNYYGAGKIISSNPGFSGSITFTKTTNLYVSISRIPRKIERTVSFFCQTQKVRSSRTWDIQGMEMYPTWKMDEIEDMLQAESIVADGLLMIYRGGDAAFSQIVNGCTGRFRLRFSLENCPVQQIYGCDDNCVIKDKYINITDGLFSTNLTMGAFYDSNKRKIASSYDGFKLWLRNQDGVTGVEEVDNSSLTCSSFKLLKVYGDYNILGAYYVVDTNPNNKIYIREVDDINDLCNGQNNELCAAPILGTPELYALTCNTVIYGTPELSYMGRECSILPGNGWVQGLGNTNIIAGIDSTEINLSLTNNSFIGKASSQENLIFNQLNSSGSPLCSVSLPNGVGSVINQVIINNVLLNPDKYTFNSTTGVINITDPSSCAQIKQYFFVSYNVTTESYNYLMSGQTVAQINGGCLPLYNVYLTNSCNASIPNGVTILIQPDGEIKWWGPLSYSDNNGSKIDVTNLTF